MASVGMIQIIRPFVNASEKEYIKKFLRFIGCFVIDSAVDEIAVLGWDKGLRPSNENGGVDIVLNYFGEDPYLTDCERQGIKRLYLYFWFNGENGELPACELVRRPLAAKEDVKGENYFKFKIGARKKALECLIEAIWEKEPQERETEKTGQNIKNIFRFYTENKQGDLFYLLQTKRSLRTLHIVDFLDMPSVRAPHISWDDYIKQMMNGLWETYVRLEAFNDIYSTFARIYIACFIQEVNSLLDESDRESLEKISFDNKTLLVFDARDLIWQALNLLKIAPQFISLYLLMACLCKSVANFDRAEEQYYLKILETVPCDQKRYAHVWYRIGLFYERVRKDEKRAWQCYHRAYEADSQCYQALFKLGFFSAMDGSFNDADYYLDVMIQTVFHNRDAEDPEGKYPQWEYLSLKDLQYVYKAYILRAKVAINSNREYSARAFIGKACLAATRFEETPLERKSADAGENDFECYRVYHLKSASVRTMWRILEPWTERIVYDPYIQGIVRYRLRRWE